MSAGELATRVTIWIAMAGYCGSLGLLIHGSSKKALVVYTAGLLAFVFHIVLAFGVFYQWSHTIAWRETANQTQEMTGNRSGHGLYLNYLLGAVWITDAFFWWRRRKPLHLWNRSAALVLHGFFLFMVVNGGIIFAKGAVRWFTSMLKRFGVDLPSPIQL